MNPTLTSFKVVARLDEMSNFLECPIRRVLPSKIAGVRSSLHRLIRTGVIIDPNKPDAITFTDESPSLAFLTVWCRLVAANTAGSASPAGGKCLTEARLGRLAHLGLLL
jgi:hypothetical protein